MPYYCSERSTFEGIFVGSCAEVHRCCQQMAKCRGGIPTYCFLVSVIPYFFVWQVIIIDEVSMLSKHLFESLDFIARSIRGVDAPFGGIQMVLFGDFFQLPPPLERVPRTSDDTSTALNHNVHNLFCFQSPLWESAGFWIPPAAAIMENNEKSLADHAGGTILLTSIYRQKDPTFVNILNEIRVGDVSAESLATLDR